MKGPIRQKKYDRKNRVRRRKAFGRIHGVK